MNEECRKRIFRMFYFDGLAPSQIDRLLGLVDGAARRVIVDYWQWEGIEKW